MSILEDALEPFDPMGDDVGEVALMRTPDGAVVFVPRAIQSLSGAGLSAFGDLEKASMALREAQLEVEKCVAECRAAKVSWNSVGWVLGITGSAARQRFGPEQ